MTQPLPSRDRSVRYFVPRGGTWLTTAQVAARLGIARQSVRRVVVGRAEVVRDRRGRLLFSGADIDAIAPPNRPGDLTPEAAARILHTTARALRDLADAGVLDSSRTPGGERRYYRRQITALRRWQTTVREVR
jgi:hypothetical protein